MLSKEERMANLRRASAMTRMQDAQIQNTLSGMSNEQVECFIDQNPDVAEMLSISADSDNSGIVVNYANQPNNQQEISISPPWETNFSVAGQPQGRVNLFQVGSNPTTGMSFNYGFGMNSNDERFKKYTPGMRLYGINPYNFPNANQMIDYFNMLEKQREFAQNQQYGWALISARTVGTQEMLDWAESLKFKPADQVYKEMEESKTKAEQERIKAMTEEGNDVVYDVYDVNGIRLQKACDFSIINKESGEVISEVVHKKDKLGQSFTVHTQVEDRKQQYELQQMYTQIANYNRYVDTFAKLFYKQYDDNKNRWQRWKDAGLSTAEQYAMYEDERIDWAKHQKLLERALRTASYSRDTFRDILSSCCHTELDYSNRSDFFSLSYDFERDLHYKTLISTPQEMNNDPMVHQKLQQEYDIKRKMFMDKVMSGNLGCQMATDAHYHPTFAKTPIDQLTLEDYNKPENQFMYTETVTPEIATKNMFIPENMSGIMTKEKLASMGVQLDENGQVLPQQRTIGTISIDDDTGQVLSQQEFDIGPQTGASASDSMSDDVLKNLF
jgi:hypothetical protein